MDTPSAIGKKTTSIANSLSKNAITPCRRIGLSRPLSGSSSKLVQIRKTDSTSPEENQTTISPENVTQESTTAVPSSDHFSKQSNEINKELLRVRRCLLQNTNSNEKQSAKRTLGASYASFHVGLSPSNYNNRPVKKLKSELSSTENCYKCEKNKGNKVELYLKNASINSSIKIDKFNANREISEEIISKLLVSLLEKNTRLEQLKVQNMYAKKHSLEELRGEISKWKTAGQEALRHCLRLAIQVGCKVTIPQLMQQYGFPPQLMGYSADDDDFN